MNHAIVIGIDDYAPPGWRLTSAVTDACAFLTWAIDHDGVLPENATALLSRSEPVAPGVTRGMPDRATIQSVIRRYADRRAPVAADRLYFYFAGHGISAPGIGSGGGPVLVPMDATDVGQDFLMYPLDTVVETLRDAPAQEQFFFVDACRDFVLEDQLQAFPTVGAWLPKFGISASAQYGLFAVAPGRQALELHGKGMFTRALLQALEGDGPRLSPRGADYTLTLDNVYEYVDAAVYDEIARSGIADWNRYVQRPLSFGRVGRPAPTLWSRPRAAFAPREVSVTLNPQLARSVAELRLEAYGFPAPLDKQSPPLRDRNTVLKAPPGDYELVAEGTGYMTTRHPVLMWRTQQQIPLDLSLDEGLESYSGPNAPVTLIVSAGRGGLAIEIEHPDGALVRRVDEAQVRDGKPGLYRVRVTRPDGDVVKKEYALAPGAYKEWKVEMPPMRVSTSVASLLGARGLQPSPSGYEAPSERLPEVPDLSLGGMLGLAAFAQAYPQSGDMQRLRSLGVAVPEVDAADGAITVVVAAAGDHRGFLGSVRVVVDGLRHATELLSGFPAATQIALPVAPRVHEVTVQLPGLPDVNYAVAALPGWVTVLIVVTQERPGIEVQQYTVAGDPSLRQRGSIPEPAALLACERAQRLFAGGRPDSLTTEQLGMLLLHKWFDPLFACVGGYALAYREELDRWRGMPMQNMLRHFHDLPDTHVLAGLAEPSMREEHFEAAIERGVPVFATGLRELHGWLEARGDEIPPSIAIAHKYLVPGVVWTSWRPPAT